MVAGEWRAPVGKYADKLALRNNMELHMSFRQVRKAETLERPFQRRCPLLKTSRPWTRTLSLRPSFELPPDAAEQQKYRTES